MTKHRGKNQKKAILLTLVGFLCLGLLMAFMLRNSDIALFNPKGLIASEQHKLLLTVVGILLLIAVPALVFLYSTVWRFRDTNQKAAYNPESHHSKFMLPILWAIPIITALTIAGILWPATHRLEPIKAIESHNKPINIKVVALRWKWLFIYPEQNIATVNFVQAPVDTPIEFDITADEAPMSSFWIPHLGGQLYSMTGHVNRLNLMASEVGEYPGSTPEINGAGFSSMRFTAKASSQDDFDKWLETVRQSPLVLNTSEYEKLLEPSEKHPVVYYSSVDSSIFENILLKYSASHQHYDTETETTEYEHGEGH